MPRTTRPNSFNMVGTAKPMSAGSTGQLVEADRILRVGHAAHRAVGQHIWHSKHLLS